MAHLEEREVRLQKLDSLAKQGINAYPSTTERTHTIAACMEDFGSLSEKKQEVVIAGRIRSLRRHGGSSFAVIEDVSGRVQLFLSRDTLGEPAYDRIKNSIDLGDFLEARGTLFITKTEERTLHVSQFTILAKALLPLPEQWHGLSDVEIRYRQRELDLIANPEVRERFIVRSKLISGLRTFLDGRGFLEVETPMLQPIPGGANARPFITHHNALDTDFYLRIAPELYLKRLIVGGFEKVYEIGRLFRNEGIDQAHNPEFTAIEFYWAYVPNKDFFIGFLEELMRFIITHAVGSAQVSYGGGTIDFETQWAAKTFRDAVLEVTRIDIDTYRTEATLVAACEKEALKVDFSHCIGIGECYDQLYKKLVRPTIHQPTWIFDYPLELKPLAKASPSDPTKSASVQLIIEGDEIINAYYHELNDPIDQRTRFVDQEALRERGSGEAQFLDEEFLLALEYGMPPTSGMGMGIDRLVALLTGMANLKDIILFPTLRPRQQSVTPELSE